LYLESNCLKLAGNLKLTISQTVENNRVLLAFSRVLDILGEPSRNMIIAYIQKKYNLPLFSSISRLVSVEDIEDALQEVFPIGSELIIRMLDAEIDRMEQQG
jgi:hypothetical protein